MGSLSSPDTTTGHKTHTLILIGKPNLKKMMSLIVTWKST